VNIPVMAFTVSSLRQTAKFRSTSFLETSAQKLENCMLAFAVA
jgi:hypothetical protein